MSSPTRILRVGFRPQTEYAFSIEVFSADEWLGRVPKSHLSNPTRLDFHQLILVSKGQFGHWVDCHLESIRGGSLLAMRPGQVQRFEVNKPWSGWVIIFRPESFQPTEGLDSRALRLSIDDIPSQLHLNKASFDGVSDVLEQIRHDTSLAGSMQLVSSLIRAQLQALLLRLLIISEQQQITPSKDSLQARHFRRFREATEEKLHEWHQVAVYSKLLGISEKTLSRASQAVAGLSSKAYLSKRIALEAKRLLAHTNWPITQVADKLGFDEVSNFIKFFRREAGYSPSEFRKQQRGNFEFDLLGNNAGKKVL